MLFICKLCSNKFDKLESHKPKFCSRECYYKFRSIYYRGDKHPLWKENINNYQWLHQILRKIWVIPEKCDRCGEKKKLDLANITGIYNKHRENWSWLCRKCHMTTDGRLDKTRDRSKFAAEKAKEYWISKGRKYV